MTTFVNEPTLASAHAPKATSNIVDVPVMAAGPGARSQVSPDRCHLGNGRPLDNLVWIHRYSLGLFQIHKAVAH